MKQITLGGRSLLIGDEAADLLGLYAALLGRIGSADFVELHCIDADADADVAGFLLNGGVSLVVERARTRVPEPDNAAGVRYMRTRLDLYEEF